MKVRIISALVGIVVLVGILMILFKVRETKGIDLNTVTGHEE